MCSIELCFSETLLLPWMREMATTNSNIILDDIGTWQIITSDNCTNSNQVTLASTRAMTISAATQQIQQLFLFDELRLVPPLITSLY